MLLRRLVAAGILLKAVMAAPAMDVRLYSAIAAGPAGSLSEQAASHFPFDGTFKITVFSDLHYGENAWDAWGPQQDVNSTRLMNIVLDDEKPDFVWLNGDQITGENTFLANSTVYIDEIIAPLVQKEIPFCSIQGNHDNDANITHLAEILREQEHAPLSYTRLAPPGVGGSSIYGPGTYWVPVYAHPNDFQPALILWAFDSRDGRTFGTDPQQLPDWVDDSVANWIESETTLMNEVWGPGDKTRGALAFVHIPPYAIQAVWETLNSTINPGLDADALGDGSTQGTTVSGNIGQDQPFWDALNANVKNLHAVISGHDHGDEWCAREPTKNVIFCFAKHSGYGGYSDAGWGHVHTIRPKLAIFPTAVAAFTEAFSTKLGHVQLQTVFGYLIEQYLSHHIELDVQIQRQPLLVAAWVTARRMGLSAVSILAHRFPDLQPTFHDDMVKQRLMKLRATMTLSRGSHNTRMHYSNSLPNGVYHIMDSSQTMYVGRSLTEDLSVSPKPVISVTPKDKGAQPKWLLQRCPEGKYTLKIANAPVGGVSGALFAFLHPLHSPEEWVITHLQGRLYTIETPEQTASWVLPQRVGPHAQASIVLFVLSAALNSHP
ncbi:hypothetical protein NM688_g4128 [Phlebia brevispora]|uniref:Uncharacterized protein n=1 Tax=Phlebia brevispora TaxID=194682 RepID=A0ACC1T3I7_9APHY|nr:hypothetical protein NM688_g4128 [Phlebia brevispora]